jgi:hypothetical protein
MATIISSITNEPWQIHELIITGFDSCEMEIKWNDTQSAWFARFTWGDFEVAGLKLTMSPNILSQFANKIPFGIAIISNTLQDPITLDSLSNGTTEFWILSAAEVEELAAVYG